MTEDRANLLAFVDTETTGLDPVEHHVWEVACLLYDRAARRVVLETTWQLWLSQSAIEEADPVALKVGRFWDRRWHDEQITTPVVFAPEFATMTRGLPIVGANPSFDTERLARILWRSNEEPGWHYRPIDIEALAVGYLHGLTRGAGVIAGVPEAAEKVPWSSTKVCEALGVDRPKDQMHTALGDCRWALAVWQTVMGHDRARADA